MRPFLASICAILALLCCCPAAEAGPVRKAVAAVAQVRPVRSVARRVARVRPLRAVARIFGGGC